MNIWFNPLLPMKAKTGDEAFLKRIETDPDWIVARKWDGARTVIILKNSGNKLITSGFRNVVQNIPQFKQIIPELDNTVIDSEALVTSLYLGDVHSVFHSSLAHSQQWQQEHHHHGFLLLFDCIKFKGRSLVKLPLRERQKYLRDAYYILRRYGMPVKIEKAYSTGKSKVFQDIIKTGGEGVMAKHLTAPYQAGVRSSEWIKVKTQNTWDFVITGFIPGQGKYKNMVGAVKYGTLTHDIGKSSGMTDAIRIDMTQHPNKYINKVAEFEAMEMTKDGVLRHPRFIKMRPDKKATGITASGGVVRL